MSFGIEEKKNMYRSMVRFLLSLALIISLMYVVAWSKAGDYSGGVTRANYLAGGLFLLFGLVGCLMIYIEERSKYKKASR